jgi:hypothetical protein
MDVGYPGAISVGGLAACAEYCKLTDGPEAGQTLHTAYNLNGTLHLTVLSGDKVVGRQFDRNTWRYAFALDQSSLPCEIRGYGQAQNVTGACKKCTSTKIFSPFFPSGGSLDIYRAISCSRSQSDEGGLNSFLLFALSMFLI